MKIRGYSGDITLEEMEDQIRFEEAGSLQLLDCIVATDKNNQPINVLKFKELDPGEIPPDIKLVKHGSPKPADVQGPVLPDDTLVIEKQFTVLSFFRSVGP